MRAWAFSGLRYDDVDMVFTGCTYEEEQSHAPHSEWARQVEVLSLIRRAKKLEFSGGPLGTGRKRNLP